MLGITASIHSIWGLLFHYFNNLSFQLLEYIFIFLLTNIKHEVSCREDFKDLIHYYT